MVYQLKRLAFAAGRFYLSSCVVTFSPPDFKRVIVGGYRTKSVERKRFAFFFLLHNERIDTEISQIRQ